MPKRAGRASVEKEAAGPTLFNYYKELADEGHTKPAETDGEEETPPAQFKPKSKKPWKAKNAQELEDILTTQLLEKPVRSSYLLPGKIEGKPVQLLLDTGCNTNLLSKHTFDRLPERVKKTLEKCDSHGLMADGSKLPFYGTLRVPGRVQDIKIEETYVVSCISEDIVSAHHLIECRSKHSIADDVGVMHCRCLIDLTATKSV